MIGLLVSLVILKPCTRRKRNEKCFTRSPLARTARGQNVFQQLRSLLRNYVSNISDSYNSAILEYTIDGSVCMTSLLHHIKNENY